jgi:phosphorylase kinase alpha/beta subunit
MTSPSNQPLQKIPREDYNLQDISDIQSLLEKHKVFELTCLANGLFPASASADAITTGYKNIWIRDNIFIAYANYISGKSDIALKNVRTLLQYFKKYRFRFERVIDAQVKPSSSMERPHIRFDGIKLDELDEEWEHAQNDALGYFLWLFSKLHAEGEEVSKNFLDADDLEILALFPLYFEVIHFWEDEDSGHWEEAPKLEASSIGVVVAGLKELKNLIMKVSSSLSDACQYKGKIIDVQRLDRLIQCGYSALDGILPSECIQASPKYRRYDSALLFLVYPLEIVSGDLASQIVTDIITNLQGDFGIRRYIGDDFWCRDFQNLPKNIQNSKHTDRQGWLREHAIEIVFGEEAQWCIFDPIISSYYGHKYQSESGSLDDLRMQIQYFNRSLRQITREGYMVKEKSSDGISKDIKIAENKCPELYYIQEGRYSPNTSTPLLWTQANLLIAFAAMRQSLAKKIAK